MAIGVQHTQIDGRPAAVLFINDNFDPVEEENATLVRVIFTDDRGGSMFLVPSGKKAEEEESKQWTTEDEKAPARKRSRL